MQLIVFITLSILFFSCKKEKPQAPNPSPKIDDIIYPDYAHLKTGNYWIYQVFEVDTLGNAIATSQYDSVYISKDTSINGKLYAVRVDYQNPAENISYLRDSLHYIVNSYGRIVFTSVEFGKVFHSSYFDWGANTDTVAFVEHLMTGKDENVSVPAGTFTTMSFTQRWNMYPKYRNSGALIQQRTRYNLGVGIVTESLPFNFHLPIRKERRLIRYSVK